MTRPRDEKGRYMRADGKPTLHRQVADWHRPHPDMMQSPPEPWPAPDPKPSNHWPLLLLFGLLGLVVVAALVVLAARDGGLLP